MRERGLGFKAGLIGLVAAFVVNVALAQSQQKIATIDLQKVFDNYYKTKIADSQLKDRGDEFEKTLKGMYADYKELQKEYQKLLESADSQVISQQERRNSKQQAQKKLKEMRRLEQEVQKYDQRAKTTLQEQQRRMRERILKEVRKVVEKVARTEGYTMVLDTAAHTINQTPVLVYNSGGNDISDRVLKRLNADAPDNLPQLEESSDEEEAPGPSLPDLPSPGGLNGN